jgi:cytochrome c oxidase subunit IV
MSTNDSNGTTGKQVHTLPLVKEGPLHGPETHEEGTAEHHHGHAEHPPSHGHPSGSGDHVPHVLDLKVYLATFGALLVLTAITVGASYVDFGSANILIALLIATIKAATVALMFMHLKYDHRFHAIIFSFSLIFLAIFIAFTMYDTETRGRADAVQADRSQNVKAPFKGTTLDDKATLKLKEKYGVPTDKPMPEQNLTPPQN